MTLMPYLQQTSLFHLFHYSREGDNVSMLNAAEDEANALRKWDEIGAAPVVQREFDSFDEIEARFARGSQPQTGLAFRGESRASGRLESKLFRVLKATDSAENAREVLVKEFRNEMRRKFGDEWFRTQGEPTDDHKLTILQHYGSPTPLLDWTESLDIAAFFAFEQAPEQDNDRVVIYVVDIGKMHLWTHCLDKMMAGTPNQVDPVAFLNTPAVRFTGNYWTFVRQPSFWDIRLSAQMGLFSWQGTRVPLDTYLSGDSPVGATALPRTLLKATLPVAERPRVMRHLDLRGITQDSLFGGWQEICRQATKGIRNHLADDRGRGNADGH